MCWITRKEELTKPKIAKRNIKCFKIVRGDYDSNASFFMAFKYEEGKEYSMDKLAENAKYEASFDCYTVNEGFHSYPMFEDDCNKLEYVFHVESPTLYTAYSIKCMECVIPKGSRYYVNEKKEMVSERLLVKKIRHFQRKK